VLAALALAAGGCGQKGPLMLPAAKAPAATANSAAVSASSASAPVRNP
jgi:predicted small lipoprotein YifL